MKGLFLVMIKIRRLLFFWTMIVDYNLKLYHFTIISSSSSTVLLSFKQCWTFRVKKKERRKNIKTTLSHPRKKYDRLFMSPCHSSAPFTYKAACTDHQDKQMAQNLCCAGCCSLVIFLQQLILSIGHLNLCPTVLQ